MENECVVCYSDNSLYLSCNHTVCLPCVKKIIKISGLCPICRNKFDNEQFKYRPPKRLNDLKFSTKNKKILNRFLSNRNFLTPCKKMRIFSHLLYYHCDLVCFQNKYIHIDSMLLGEITYDPDYLIDCLLWLTNNNKIYSYSSRQNIIYAIRSTLCSLWL